MEELAAAGLPLRVVDSLAAEGVLSHSDVLYITRVQKERFASLEAYERLKHAFVVTRETLRGAKASAIVMHPLPRVGEIATEVDSDPRAAYFDQMRCGLYVRMALLALVCGHGEAEVEAAAAAAATAAAGAKRA